MIEQRPAHHKKLLIVYNPRSGRQLRAPTRKRLGKMLEKNFEVEHFNIRTDKLTELLASRTFNALAVIGGDGTIRSVVDILQRRRIDIPIAILARGSANVLAKSIGASRSLKKTARIIARGKTISLDVAKLSTGEHFVSAFAMGYLSKRIVEANPSAKSLFGFGGYLLSFIRETKLPLHAFTINADGRKLRAKGHSAIIVNATNVFGVSSSRTAGHGDGILELIVTTNSSFWNMLGLVFDFYFRKRDPRHFLLVPGKKFSVASSSVLSKQIDGEALLPGTTAEISVVAQRQRFIVP